jgi:uncharacterized protein YciI
MAEFLYRIEPTRPGMLAEGPTSEESAIVERHFRYLKDLSERGIVRLAGRTTNADARAFGIVILEAASEAEAAGLMRDDPAVKHGVMRAELFAFRTALQSYSR